MDSHNRVDPLRNLILTRVGKRPGRRRQGSSRTVEESSGPLRGVDRSRVVAHHVMRGVTSRRLTGAESGQRHRVGVGELIKRPCSNQLPLVLLLTLLVEESGGWLRFHLGGGVGGTSASGALHLIIGRGSAEIRLGASSASDRATVRASVGRAEGGACRAPEDFAPSR